MCGDRQKNSIKITSNRTPVLRAGLGNTLLLLLTIAVTLLNELLTDIEVSVVLRITFIVVFCLVGLTFYLRCVSQVSISENDELILENPFGGVKIELAHIKRVSIRTIPASKTAFLGIKKKGKRLSSFYFFVAVHTSCGSFEETIEKLSHMVQKLGSV